MIQIEYKKYSRTYAYVREGFPRFICIICICIP